MKNKSKTSKANIAVIFIMCFTSIIFLWLIGYFAFFIAKKGELYTENSYNPRYTDESEYVIRGNILAEDGTILATTKIDENGNESRYYEYPAMFAHAVGYSTAGKTGIEEMANSYLTTSNMDIMDQIEAAKAAGIKIQGDSVTTTLDVNLQQSAYNMMSLWDGAIIAIEPSTGKIKCMVSKPDFNTNSIKDNYSNLVADNTNAVLLNRCTQGMYPPGSTFKVVTTLAYLDQGYSLNDFNYQCNGAISVMDDIYHCYGGQAHGRVDLHKAFYKSCNCAFGTMGLGLDISNYQETAEKLFFNNDIPTDMLNVKKSSFALDLDSDNKEIAQTGFGQGETLVTPLQMCLIASAICNDGEAMKPYLLESVQSEDGYLVQSFKPESIGQITSKNNAAVLQGLMRECVTDGTGKKLKDAYTYEAYGKTGTAEISDVSADCHSWFMGYAKGYNGKELAIAIIMERAGNSSYAAVPIAQNVFDAYFSGL